MNTRFTNEVLSDEYLQTRPTLRELSTLLHGKRVQTRRYCEIRTDLTYASTRHFGICHETQEWFSVLCIQFLSGVYSNHASVHCFKSLTSAQYTLQFLREMFEQIVHILKELDMEFMNLNKFGDEVSKKRDDIKTILFVNGRNILHEIIVQEQNLFCVPTFKQWHLEELKKNKKIPMIHVNDQACSLILGHSKNRFRTVSSMHELEYLLIKILSDAYTGDGRAPAVVAYQRRRFSPCPNTPTPQFPNIPYIVVHPRRTILCNHSQ